MGETIEKVPTSEGSPSSYILTFSDKSRIQIQVGVFMDTSLSNLNNGAQLVILRNGFSDIASILWQANNIKGVVDSSLATEVTPG